MKRIKKMKNSNVLVSVSVVTYNHKDYIAQCLDGILMQKTNFPFEIIVGEDESNDGTREICIEYANKYPDKINLFLRSRKDVIFINGKPTGRFNFIENIKVAKGKYIAICEGDDYRTDPLKLQKQVDFLEKNKDYILCFTNASIINENNEISLKEIITDFSKTSFTHIDMPIKAPTLTRVFKNEKLLNIRHDVYGLDTFLLIWFSKFGKIKFINDITGVYRLQNKGIYSSLSKKDKIFHQFKTRLSCLEIIDKQLYLKFYSILFLLLLKFSKFKDQENYIILLGELKDDFNNKKMSFTMTNRLTILFLFKVFEISKFDNFKVIFRIKRKLIFKLVK